MPSAAKANEVVWHFGMAEAMPFRDGRVDSLHRLGAHRCCSLIGAMASPPRTASHGTFFLTAPTWNRRPIFQVEAHAQLFLDTLQHYRREGNYKLHAFVAMPDHVHLLLTPVGITIERAMQLIKGGFSHRIGSSFPVWQRGYTDHRIRNREEFETRKAYIHLNPVRARLCERPEEYRWSSAYRTSAAEVARG